MKKSPYRPNKRERALKKHVLISVSAKGTVRRQFSMDFKIAAVKAVYATSLSDVSRNLGIHSSSLSLWRRQHEEGRLTPQFAIAFSRRPVNVLTDVAQLAPKPCK